MQEQDQRLLELLAADQKLREKMRTTNMINSDVLAEFKEDNDQMRVRAERDAKIKRENEILELKKNAAINLFLSGVAQLDHKAQKADVTAELKPIEEFLTEAERQVTDIRNECMRLNGDMIKKHQQEKRLERNC